MTHIIHVPLDSPAFESYLHEGWRQVYVDGLWATLRLDRDRRSPGGKSGPAREASSEQGKTGVSGEAA